MIQVTSFANIDDFKLTSYMELWAHYAQNHEGFCVEYEMCIRDRYIKDGHFPAVTTFPKVDASIRFVTADKERKAIIANPVSYTHLS